MIWYNLHVFNIESKTVKSLEHKSVKCAKYKLIYLWLLFFSVSIIAKHEVSGSVTYELRIPITGVNFLVKITDRATVSVLTEIRQYRWSK